MSYTFPTRRTQVTNMIIHASALLDTGGYADFGTLTVGNLTSTGIIQGNNLSIINDAYIGNNLSIINNLDMGGNLAVLGNTFLDGTLDVSNLITALTNIFVTNQLDVGLVANINTIVANEATISNLHVLNNLVAQYLQSYDVSVSNNYFLYNQIIVPGSNVAIVDWDHVDHITVLGTANIHNLEANISIINNLSVLLSSNLQGDTLISNLVSSNVTIDRLSVLVDSNLHGNTTINNLVTATLHVLEGSNLQGNTFISNIVSTLLSVTGDANFANIVTIDTLNILRSSNLQGNTFISNLVSTQGLFIDLTANTSTFDNLLSFSSNLQGNTFISNVLTVDGDAYFANIVSRDLVLDTLKVLQTSNLQGNTFISNLVSAQGLFTGNLISQMQTTLQDLYVSNSFISVGYNELDIINTMEIDFESSTGPVGGGGGGGAICTPEPNVIYDSGFQTNTAGIITVHTVTNIVNSNIFTVQFGTPYVNIPSITITQAGIVQSNVYLGFQSNVYFTMYGTLNGSLTINYHVIGT